MIGKMVTETRSPEETYELGRKIGLQARPGQVYTLTGDLGVGKTVFTQGFAAGLGIKGPVSSPFPTRAAARDRTGAAYIAISRPGRKGYRLCWCAGTGISPCPRKRRSQ